MKPEGEVVTIPHLMPRIIRPGIKTADVRRTCTRCGQNYDQKDSGNHQPPCWICQSGGHAACQH